MESSSKVREWMDTLIDYLNEQVWFQELKGKWEELDPQSRTNLQFAAFGIIILSVFFLILTVVWSVHSLKSELKEKRALLNTIQAANEEVRRIRDVVPNGGMPEGGNREGGSWPTYFESLAQMSGCDKSNLSVSAEKAGSSTDQSKELLFDLNLKHVSIKQVIRYAFTLENGQRPVKVRNLLIDTKGDPTGYMDATLAISAFSLVKHE